MPPLRIIQFSDTHITKMDNFVKSSFQKGMQQINRIKADYVVHTGDITHNGLYEEYQYADELFQKFDQPILFIPGNHDVKNLGEQLYEEFFSYRSFITETSTHALLGLDSTIPDLDTGRIGDYAITKLDQSLSQIGDKKIKVVLFHHHLLPVANAGRERSFVVDAGNLLEVLLQHEVHLVLTGHRHSFNVMNIGQSAHQTTIVNAGTFSSYKTRGKEGHTFNILEVHPKRNLVHLNPK